MKDIGKLDQGPPDVHGKRRPKNTNLICVNGFPRDLQGLFKGIGHESPGTFTKFQRNTSTMGTQNLHF